MAFSDELDTMAGDIESTFGVEVTLVNPSRSGFNTTTGRAIEFETSSQHFVVLGPVDAGHSAAGASQRPVERRDFTFQGSVDVQSGMTIIYNGNKWTVVAVSPESNGKLKRARAARGK